MLVSKFDHECSALEWPRKFAAATCAPVFFFEATARGGRPERARVNRSVFPAACFRRLSLRPMELNGFTSFSLFRDSIPLPFVVAKCICDNCLPCIPGSAIGLKVTSHCRLTRLAAAAHIPRKIAIRDRERSQAATNLAMPNELLFLILAGRLKPHRRVSRIAAPRTWHKNAITLPLQIHLKRHFIARPCCRF